MDFNGPLFWFLMGLVFAMIVSAFRSFAARRGLRMTWWKWLLTLAWLVFVGASVYALGTLVGENEAAAGVRIFLVAMLVGLVLGVGLWRLLAERPGTGAGVVAK